MRVESERLNPNSGDFILDQLQWFGSDVNKRHEVSFWLYFPCENKAREAGTRAARCGLTPEISPPITDARNQKWLCLLYCPHVPDKALLDGICDYCSALASELDGNFDGWEASLELEETESPTAG